MNFYKYYKEEAKNKLSYALAMLEQYTFKEGLEWGKDNIDHTKGNSKTKRLKKCEDIVREYIEKKWG